MIPQDILVGVHEAGKHPLVRAMDLMEVAPPLDIGDMTSKLGAEILLYYLCGLRRRSK